MCDVLYHHFQCVCCSNRLLLDISETIRVGLGLKLVDFEQSERFRAAPKLGLGGRRLCGRGTARIVFAPHVPCELTLSSCPVRTFLACVWFDARVRPHVRCEMTLGSCPVCTCLACVWGSRWMVIYVFMGSSCVTKSMSDILR